MTPTRIGIDRLLMRATCKHRRAFGIAAGGCLVRMGEDEPRYATVAEIATRLEPHADAAILVAAISEAVGQQ